MKTPPAKYEYIKKWKKLHPEKLKEYRKKYILMHKDRVRKIQAESYKKWKKAHPDYYKKYWERQKANKSLLYERNKLIYQARMIQGLSYQKIADIFSNKGRGRPLSRERVRQIIEEYERSLKQRKKLDI